MCSCLCEQFLCFKAHLQHYWQCHFMSKQSLWKVTAMEAEIYSSASIKLAPSREHKSIIWINLHPSMRQSVHYVHFVRANSVRLLTSQLCQLSWCLSRFFHSSKADVGKAAYRESLIRQMDYEKSRTWEANLGKQTKTFHLNWTCFHHGCKHLSCQAQLTSHLRNTWDVRGVLTLEAANNCLA